LFRKSSSGIWREATTGARSTLRRISVRRLTSGSTPFSIRNRFASWYASVASAEISSFIALSTPDQASGPKSLSMNERTTILASCCGRNRSWSASSSRPSSAAMRVLQVVQLPDGLVDDGLGQARDEDLLLHRLVVDQHQLLRVALHRRQQRAGAGGRPVGDAGVAQHLALALDPLLAMGHQGLQRVAALLRHRALGRLVELQARRLQHGGKQARPRLGKLLGEHLPSPACDIWRRFALDHPAASLPLGDSAVCALSAIYTTAPSVRVIRIDLALGGRSL
jgi:hypothetical protein